MENSMTLYENPEFFSELITLLFLKDELLYPKCIN